jgi:hypothetical protein
MDGAGKVFAQVPEFSADIKKKLVEGKLRYISAEFYEFDKINAEQPPYLKAVALLGRDTPAVAGTKITLFTLMADGGLAVIDEAEHITAFTRKAGAGEIKHLTKEGQKGGAMDELEELKVQAESLRTELAAEKEKAAAFQRENEGLRDAEKKSEAVAYFEKLRNEGKLHPALFDKTVALDTKLTEEQRKAFRGLFGELDQILDMSGTHIAEKKSGASARAGSGTLTAKIRAFQKEKHMATFEEAAGAMYAEHPELFEAGGAI